MPRKSSITCGRTRPTTGRRSMNGTSIGHLIYPVVRKPATCILRLMVELRPLILVTGTIHAEGGRTHKVESSSGSRFVQKRDISKDRRSADVISTTYMRRLRQLRILRTPFGTLIDPAKLDAVKTMINE